MNLKNRHGYTFTEVTITVALLGVLALAVPRTFLVLTTAAGKADARMIAMRDLQATSFQLERLIRNAQPDTVEITQEGGQPFYSELKFIAQDTRSLKIYQSGPDLKVDDVIAGVTHTTVVQRGGLKRLLFTYPDITNTNQIQFSLTENQGSYSDSVYNVQRRIYFAGGM